MKTKLGMIIAFLFIASLLMARDNILLVNYGPKQSIREGDDDFQQIIYFQIDDTYSDSLYIRIFDIDCGGDVDLSFGGYNTRTRFDLFGGDSAFTAPTLKNPKPDEADINAGRSLASHVIGENSELNNSWYNFAHISARDGEKFGDSFYFKLVVQGVSGDDANAYDVRLSTSATMNVTAPEFSMFSNSPTFRLRKDENIASIKFFVPEDVRKVTINNFDLAGASMQLVSAFRSNLTVVSSGQGEWVKSTVALESIETMRECALALGQGGESPNDVSLYITDDKNRVLPIHLPIYLKKLNHRPVIQKTLIALSDCQSIVFDAKSSTDQDGDILEFYWELGDGTTATGSRIVHQYQEQKTYQALLIVKDNSGEVGNSAFERFQVTVNKPPRAIAGPDIITAPNEIVTLDGSSSSDQDGRLINYEWDFGDGASASDAIITHRFASAGTYRTTLRVTDNSDSPCNFATDEISVWVNAAPLAFAGDDMRGSVGQSMILNGERSSDSDGEIVAYHWDFGDGGEGSGKIVHYIYKAPGTYVVRLSVTDNANVGNSTQYDELSVFINEPAVANAGKDMKGAIDEPLLFDGGNSFDNDGVITNYIWDFGDGTRGEGKQISHAYTKSGVYTVALTVQDNSGTDSNKSSDSLQVFINQPPVADAGEDQLLTASEVTFSASGSRDLDGKIIDYEWDYGDGLTGSGVNPAHVYRRPGTYRVKLTVKDDSGTKNDRSSDFLNVVINEKPIADAGPDQSAASGQILTFDGSGSRDADGAITEYLWDFGDGVAATGQTVSHQYNKPGIYAIRLSVKDDTEQAQAVDYDETVVMVNSRPVADAGPDILVAPAESILFDGSGSFDQDKDSLSFEWSFSDGKHPAITAKTRRAFSLPGIYSGILTVSDNSMLDNGVARDTVIIRINSAPIANAGKNIFSCDETLLLDGSASVDPDGDPLTFTWDFGDGSEAIHGVQVLHKYDHGGNYPVILTVDDGLGLANSRHSTAITAVINDPPMANAGENESYCSGEVIIFNASNSRDPENGLLKYFWDFGDSTTAEGLNPTKIYKKDGVYQVKLTVQDDSGLPCNTDVAIKSIEIIESPVAIAGPDQEVCTHTQVFFDGTASRDFDGVVNSYFWDFGDGTTGGGATPTHSYKKAGVYRVVLTITGDLRGDCDNSNTDELLVTVHNAPLAQFSAVSITPVNRPVVLDASSSVSDEADIIEYLWDFGDGSEGSGKMITHQYKDFGIYLIKLTIRTSANTICNSSIAQKMIIVNQQPVADAGDDRLVGVNQVFLLDGSKSMDPDGSIVAAHWDFGSSESLSGIIARHRIGKVGRHPILLTVVDNTNAENNSAVDTVWVTVSDPVIPVITASEVACPGEIVHFSVMNSKNLDRQGTICNWNFGDGQTAQGMEVTHQYAKSGRYNVIVMIDDGLMLDNSKTDASKTVFINHRPVANAGGDRLTCPGQELVFDASKSYDLDETDWKVQWDFGDGHKSMDKIARHVYQKSGHYSVKLRVTDNSGGSCSMGDDVIDVIVNSAPTAVAGPDRQVFFGGAHDAVLFDGTGSTDADGDGLKYEWDFGDGSRYSGAKLYHTYDKPGIYWVRLVVDDGRKTPCSRSQDEIKIEVMNRN
ncbi:PKD domain-containing protein [candidate division KSB1 bacterium]|nr:PKD domain-containing protein [candidate division KSB1 bacterium]